MKVAQAGSGLSIVFIHGLGWDHKLWDGAFERYSDRYHVVAGDTRGHGDSDKPKGPYSVRQFADDWRGALDSLMIQRACLVGFSQGGMISMHLALDEPDRFVGLALVSTLCRIDPVKPAASGDRMAKLREEGPQSAARQSAELIFSPAFRAQHPEFIDSFIAKRAAFPLEPLMAAMQAGEGFNVCDELSAYKNPCLVAAGSEDALTKPDSVRLVSDSIPGSRFILVEGAGHMIPVEQPATFYALIDNFIDDCVAR